VPNSVQINMPIGKTPTPKRCKHAVQVGWIQHFHRFVMTHNTLHCQNLRHRVGGGGAVNEGLPKFSDLQKMWGHKVFFLDIFGQFWVTFATGKRLPS